jgi:hypothetical protein
MKEPDEEQEEENANGPRGAGFMYVVQIPSCGHQRCQLFHLACQIEDAEFLIVAPQCLSI